MGLLKHRSMASLFVGSALLVGCDIGPITPIVFAFEDRNSDEDDISDRNFEMCDASLTCEALENPDDCIADFEGGSTHAGLGGVGEAVGFYAYGDGTPQAVMTPAITEEIPTPAKEMKSCDDGGDYVLHVSGRGFSVWGAGVAMSWGGPLNPACDSLDSLFCRRIAFENPSFLLAEAAEDPRCDTEEKLDCLKLGKRILEPRDLSEYRGIGFWALCMGQDSASMIKVEFPIPDTLRFYGECSNDDGDTMTNCNNHFFAMIRLSTKDVGRWVFKQILFDDLEVRDFWGLQLDIDTFPRDKSLGIAFHILQDQHFDFYLDDIILLR